MPASRRHHSAIAVLAHCLGILAAVPALPLAAPPPATAPPATPAAAAAAPVAAPPAAPAALAAAPTAAPAMPSAPPAVPTPTRAPLRTPATAVTVAMAPAGTPAPAYRIQVRNGGSTPVTTMVRQELPSGSTATTVTGGGQAVPADGRPAEVTWRLTLPPRGTTTLHTALRTTGPDRPLTAPTCAYALNGNQPYDCATATWNGAAAGATGSEAVPPWRRVPVLLGALAAVLALAGAGVGLWWWQRRRRLRAYAAASTPPPAAREPDPTGTPAPHGTPGPADTAAPYGASGPHGTSRLRPAPVGGGTVYPLPGEPRAAVRRRTPPVWLTVGLAAVVLAGVVGVAGWTGTRQAASIDTDQQPTSGAWVGKSAAGTLGVPLREVAFEFTVYRISCATATAAGRRCQATVGVRNLTPEQQVWHGQLQRAYLPGGTWASADLLATQAANQGRDVFAAPVAAGSRVVLPLVFSVAGREPPTHLELRSGVFSAGVRVDVP
ncbi:hypothetical protein [Micromonospora yangpuensis]|uniref:hypothetical protein n=1 Tax=Micromonospora yangpuensis TaxID=683228 RepID=UPI000B826E28|nr:hypothetical protein [Micromonospora yangpuensis]